MNFFPSTYLLSICFVLLTLPSVAQGGFVEIASEATDSVNLLCRDCYTETWILDTLKVHIREHDSVIPIFGSSDGVVRDYYHTQVLTYGAEAVPRSVIEFNAEGDVEQIHSYRMHEGKWQRNRQVIHYDASGWPKEIIFYRGGLGDRKLDLTQE